MQNFEFKLTPAYCLYNGAAVMEQNGSYIKFITESPEDSVLRRRLEKAFMNHVASVIKQKDCDSAFRNLPKVEFQEGSHEEVKNYVARLYRNTENGNFVQGGNEAVEGSLEDSERREAAAVLLLDNLLNEARSKKATDIHIEKNNIRMRISGKLEEYASIQSERNAELILRIKLLAGMNVLEKRKSQDGQFVYGEIEPVFVRVSTMGIVGDTTDNAEESVVMRLLDTKRLPLGLVHLGFSDRQLTALNALYSFENGLILICGPTGSGKSTTAASILLEKVKLSNGKLKIISLEDPVEYIIPGVTQIKVNEQIGNSFNSCLESVFRQDPDVIMIGEIRDEKSAQAALRASMTGHLVIATLHTDSVSSSILRLEDLGCSQKIISSVLRGVVHQELNHTEDGVQLVADVAAAKKILVSVLHEGKPAEEIERAFIHFTNVRELICILGRNLRRRGTVLLEGKDEAEAVNE